MRIRPNRKLALLHDAYGKHRPYILVGEIESKLNARYKQWACSCGYMYYDSNPDGSIRNHTPNPRNEWMADVLRLYAAVGLGKEMRAYWLRVIAAGRHGPDTPAIDPKEDSHEKEEA